MKNMSLFPATPSHSLGKWIDNLFNTTLSDVMGTDFTLTSPSVNVTEHEDHYMMQLAAPGLEKGDFRLQVENDYLVVSAEKKSETEDTNKRYTRKEFNYSSFKRSFLLDESINREAISAAYENGVLRVKLPKRDESWKKPNTTNIEIK